MIELTPLAEMVDVHAHLLPDLDDGPRDLAATLEMAQRASGSGIRTLVATRICARTSQVTMEKIAGRLAQTRSAIADAGIALEVVVGAEVSLVWAIEADDDALRLASTGHRGTDLLIETPNDVSMVEQLLYRVRTRGYRVTLAHPERSREFQERPERLQTLSEQGILLEVNAEALLLPSSSRRRRLAEKLCRAGAAHVLASDSHRGDGSRAVGQLAAGREALAKLVGAEHARWMTCDAPAAIVAGAPLPALSLAA